MSTGENKTALRRIADMTRLISVVMLGLHVYYCCYGAFRDWQLTMEFTDRLLLNIASTGLFRHFESSKFIALGLLLISLLGTHGRKAETLRVRSLVITVTAGLGFYFGSVLLFHLTLTPDLLTLSYFLLTGTGYLLIFSGGTGFSRLIRINLTAT